MDMQDFLLSKRPDVTIGDVKLPRSTLDKIRKYLNFPLSSGAQFKESVENFGHILLFGAPGTGKTYLSYAISNELNSVSCFSLSYYEIKKESILRELFSQAEQKKPVLIFLDDVEIFCTTEKDYQKMITSEFLHQLERLKINSSTDVLVVGMTNKPWKLDSSLLQWFRHRIEIPMPDENSRFDIFKSQLDQTDMLLTEEQVIELGRKSSGFTGSGIVVVVRDALLAPIRSIQKATHYIKVKDNTMWTPCSPDTSGAVEMTYNDVTADELLAPNISFDDLLRSLSTCRPSVNDEYLKLFAKFTQQL